MEKPTFKVGDKIKMKEDCYPLKKGDQCLLKIYEGMLMAFCKSKKGGCAHQEYWQLIKKKVCKHKYQIVTMKKTVTDTTGDARDWFSYQKDVLVAVCTKPDCLKKKYI